MSKLFTSCVIAMVLLGGCAMSAPPAPAAATADGAYDASAPVLKDGTEGLFADALSSLQEGELKRAEKLLARLTRRQPELTGPWLNLARLQLERDDLDAAKASYASALEADPQSCPAHVQLAVLLRREGEFEAARSHYMSCLEADPEFSVAHLNLGILSELYLGDLSMALVAYERYLELAPEGEPRVKIWVADLKRRLGA